MLPILTVGLFLQSAAAQAVVTPPAAIEFSYEREGQDLWRTGPHGRFRVNPEVVTVRFVSEIADIHELRTRIGATQDPRFRDLRTIRSNVLGHHDISVPAGTDVIELVRALRGTGLVEFAEENTFGEYVGNPNDTNFGNQWSLANTGGAGATAGADVNAIDAWEIEAGNRSVTIAVADSGTDYFHPDLVDNTWVNRGEIAGNGVDDDGNGFIDDVRGWDFDGNDNNPVTSFFHGTFVTGIIGAKTNNNLGIAGLAGGYGSKSGCSVMALCVGEFGPNGAVLDDAVLYAADNGARVFTMSLSVGSSTALGNALDFAWNSSGVLIDCAAGNGGGGVSYPASWPTVLAIGGTTDNDTYWTGANQGPQVWVSGPAENVYSTTLGSGYTTSSGTSFSAPHVAAIAGLIFCLKPTYTNVDVAEILKRSAKDIGSAGFDTQTGWGRIDAHAALLEALVNDCDGNGAYDITEISGGALADVNGDSVPDICESFRGDQVELSLAAGGSQTFTIDAGPAQSGWFYLVLGSLTGTSPPLDLGGFSLPLVVDDYTNLILTDPFNPLFGSYLGVLDANGQATASFNLPAGTDPSFAGIIIHHAFVSGSIAPIVDSASQTFPLVLRS